MPEGTATVQPGATPVGPDPPNGRSAMIKDLLYRAPGLFTTQIPGLLSKVPEFIVKQICGFATSSVVAFFLAFVYWLVYFRPYKLHPEIGSAVIVTFDLSHSPVGNAFMYDLTFNITVCNEHSKYAVSMSHLTTGLYYSGNKIGPSDDSIPDFDLELSSCRTVQQAFPGRATKLSATVVEAFGRERAQGQFNADIRVNIYLTYFRGLIRASYYNKYNCRLQFPPAPGNGTPWTIGGSKCGRVK